MNANPKFRWTARKARAARLLAAGLYSKTRVAEMVGISRRQLLRWRQHPKFQHHVQRRRLAIRNEVTAEFIRRVRQRTKRVLRP